MDETPDLRYRISMIKMINSMYTFTEEALKAYKSLDAYSFFIAGWVQEVPICAIKAC